MTNPEVLRQLLIDCRTALGDWMTVHAPEFSGEENVQASRGRIRRQRGTLTYAGELVCRINDELERLAVEPKARPMLSADGGEDIPL